MAVHQIEAEGVIRKGSNITVVELTENMQGLEDGMPVKILFWDARPSGERSEYEEISKVQQLELAVVAHALEAEGALRDHTSDFLKHLAEGNTD
jgi:hypothetical protein